MREMTCEQVVRLIRKQAAARWLLVMTAWLLVVVAVGLWVVGL